MASGDPHPTSNPIPVRFSEDTMALVTEMARRNSMNRATVIRLAVDTGLKIMNDMGDEGLAAFIAERAKRGR